MNEIHANIQVGGNRICPCAIKGHVSNSYARYITSSPFGFSEDGLKNKLKLLVYKANKIELTIENYYQLKFGKDEYIKINSNIKEITNIKYDQKLTTNNKTKTYLNRNYVVSSTNSYTENNYMKKLTHIRNDIYII